MIVDSPLWCVFSPVFTGAWFSSWFSLGPVSNDAVSRNRLEIQQGAAANDPLVFQQRWLFECIIRPGESFPKIVWMAAGRFAEELFLADTTNGVVRAFDVRNGQLAAHDIIRSPRRVFRARCRSNALWTPGGFPDGRRVHPANRHASHLNARLHR